MLRNPQLLTDIFNDLSRLHPEIAKTARLSSDVVDLRDSSPETRFAKSILTFPTNVGEVQTLVKLAAAHRLPIVPRGARTGLVGGATPITESLVIDMSRMNRVLKLDVHGRHLQLEPGVLLGEVEELLSQHGMMYPPDPASYRRASIGGTVATNAGGLRCVKYGVTADWVRTLDVVLPNGDLATLGHRVIKDATGLNLKQIFIGSEGTLGIIVGVGVTFCPVPMNQRLMVFGFASSEAAVSAVLELRHHIEVSMCELVDAEALRNRDTTPLTPLLGDFERWGKDPTLLIIKVEGSSMVSDLALLKNTAAILATRFAEVSPEAVPSILDVRRGVSSQQTLDKNSPRVEESLAQAVSDRVTLPQDLSVPLTQLNHVMHRIREVAAERHIESRIVAHAGDGNIHLLLVGTGKVVHGEPDVARLNAAMQELVTTVLEVGGTISGEHGVGSLKQEWAALDLGQTVEQLQRAIKTSIDPLGIMNPGKLYGTY